MECILKQFLCVICLCAFFNYGVDNARVYPGPYRPVEQGTDHQGYSYSFYQHEEIIDPNSKTHPNAHRLGGNFFCIYFGLCSINNAWAKPAFSPVYEWKILEWEYPSEQERQAAINDGTFIPGAALPIDVDIYYGRKNNNKIFVTSPRAGPGVPASVNYITKNVRDGNPTLKPYPDWSWYKNPEQCPQNRIVSCYRVQVDECGRLWVLDTGRLVDNIICPAQILAFDLETNQLVHRYEIPSNLLESRSILVTPIVDNRDATCSETFVYVADCQTYSIIVHDVKNKAGWKATDKSMYPYPNYGTFEIVGESFDLMDGVLGMALEPYKPGKDRKLFYHSLTSPTENWVYTSDLRNQSRFASEPSSSPQVFHTYKGMRASQSAAEAFDKNGVQFFGLAHETSINCWNSETEYGGNNIGTVEYNPETLQFNSGMKVITNKRGEQELWIVTDKIQKIYNGSLDPKIVNFRILAGKTEDLLSDTKCLSKRNGIGGSTSNWANNMRGKRGNRPY